MHGRDQEVQPRDNKQLLAPVAHQTKFEEPAASYQEGLLLSKQQAAASRRKQEKFKSCFALQQGEQYLEAAPSSHRKISRRLGLRL